MSAEKVVKEKFVVKGEPWLEFFPSDKAPRDIQVSAMRDIYEAMGEGKTFLLEAQCGTGKTLCALAPALALAAREGLRVLITTSVKAQTEQFIQEARDIKRTRDVNAAVLFGKSSMCLYLKKYDNKNCENRTKNTREFVKQVSEEDARTLARVLKLLSDPDVYEDVDEFREQLSTIIGKDAKRLPALCPYLLNAILRERNVQGWAADFYHWYYEDVRHPQDVYRHGKELCVCPYEMVKRQLSEAVLIICNYEHVIDSEILPHLLRWTHGPGEGNGLGGVVLIFDEAHNLEAKARDHASVALSPRTVDWGIREVGEYKSILSALEHDAADNLLRAMKSFFEGRTDLSVDEKRRGVERSVSLRSETGNDAFARCLDDVRCAGMTTKSIVDYAVAAGDKIEKMKEKTRKDEDSRVSSSVEICASFAKKYLATDGDPKYYPRISYRKVEDDKFLGFQKADQVNTSLEVKCCVPSDVTGPLMRDARACLLMSATLSPFETVQHSLGIDPGESVAHSYPPVLPAGRRLTLATGSYQITSKNRREEPVVVEVLDVIGDAVVATPGNVMVVTPTASEARMYHDRYAAPKGVKKLMDQRMGQKGILQDFFDTGTAGDRAVLFTYAWGSLVEGVDYKDDRLRTIICVGVPYKTMDDEYQAVKNAYEKLYKVNGFDYAGVYPALRRVRQAMGRVQRSDSDYGVRILVDRRYTNNSFKRAFGAGEFEEIKSTKPGEVGATVSRFFAGLKEDGHGP